MKKLFLILLLSIPLFLKAQVSGKHYSDSVGVYEDVLKNEYRQAACSSDINFFKRNDSSFVSIKSKYANTTIYAAQLNEAVEVDGYLMYNFAAEDMNQNQLILSLQLNATTKELISVGILDKRGTLLIFFINDLKPKNSL